MRSIVVGVAMIGFTCVGSSTDALAQCSTMPVTFPNRALLIPPPMFTCDIESSSLGQTSGQQSASTSNQSSPGTDVTSTMKLDYERQCYRHAVIILRDGLQQLRASLGEAFKAINKACPTAGAGRMISPVTRAPAPLSDPATLSPSAELSCELKNDSSTDITGQSASGTLRSQSGANAADRITQLDYERQCYRHAELILRDELQRLQGSVQIMIKAATSNKPAPKQPAAATSATTARQPTSAKPSLAAKPALAARASAAPKVSAAPKKQRMDVSPSPGPDLAPCAFDGDRCVGRDPDPRIRSMMLFER